MLSEESKSHLEKRWPNFSDPKNLLPKVEAFLQHSAWSPGIKDIYKIDLGVEVAKRVKMSKFFGMLVLLFGCVAILLAKTIYLSLFYFTFFLFMGCLIFKRGIEIKQILKAYLELKAEVENLE